MSFDQPSRVFKQIQLEPGQVRVGSQAPHADRLDAEQARHQALEAECQALLTKAQEEAAALLRAARQEAVELVNESRQKIQQQSEQAYQEGLQRGEAAGKAQLQQALEQFQNVMQAALAERERLLAASEQEVVHLVLEVVRRILKIEPLINEQVLIRVVKDALQRLGKQVDVHIYVNPEDVELLHFSLSQIEELALEIVIDADPQMAVGSCRILSRAGEIDANLTTQFDAVVRSFLALAEGEPVNAPMEEMVYD